MIFKVKFYSDWHCGSGLSSGADADLLVIKDSGGCPFIPGKTIKGLLLDAARTLAEVNALKQADFIEAVFGASAVEGQASRPGCARFTNATLTAAARKTVCDRTSLLFRRLSSTAIDADGQAKEHSLRTVEVAVPVTLFGEITGLENHFQADMRKCLQLVKHLGSGRNRGLGRCDMEVAT